VLEFEGGSRSELKGPLAQQAALHICSKSKRGYTLLLINLFKKTHVFS
jgi:hypothetical protein